MPISSIACVVVREMPESVIIISIQSKLHIFSNPRRPNLEESARIMVRNDASIIFLLRIAFSIFELVIPCSKSIPSTPKKSFEQVICSKKLRSIIPYNRKRVFSVQIRILEKSSRMSVRSCVLLLVNGM